MPAFRFKNLFLIPFWRWLFARFLRSAARVTQKDAALWPKRTLRFGSQNEQKALYTRLSGDSWSPFLPFFIRSVVRFDLSGFFFRSTRRSPQPLRL
jgi:hypothetical protein